MFKRYNSIENHYRQKYILNCLSQCPELQNERYVVREKIDGANIQFVFKKNEKMKVGKRSSFLTEDESFFNIWKVIDENKEILSRFQDYVNTQYCELRVYGELYGKGINDRVDYGQEQNICFFDIEINDEMLSQDKFEEIMHLLNLTNKIPPLVASTDNLTEALVISCEFDSLVLNKKNNTSEGIVIKPFFKNYTLGNGSRFILKKKSEKFKEKEGSKNKEVTKENLPENVIKLMLEFRSYINTNRVLSIFSKHGQITEPKQLGNYIQLIIEDAKEDFLKDNEFPKDLDDKVKKKIFNVGGHVVQLLKEHL